MEPLSNIDGKQKPLRYLYLNHLGQNDEKAKEVAQTALQYFSIDTGNIQTGKVFECHIPLNPEEQNLVKDLLGDPIKGCVWNLSSWKGSSLGASLVVSKIPGVTDDEGLCLQQSCYDRFSHNQRTSRQQVFCHQVYLFENKLSHEDLSTIASKIVGNPLIHLFAFPCSLKDFSPQTQKYLPPQGTVHVVPIPSQDKDLEELSKARHLCLNLQEMKAVRDYYERPDVKKERQAYGLSSSPTDCEWEIIGQTWSEHCKHKEFNGTIKDIDLQTGSERTIHSLFKSRIAASTKVIQDRFEKTGHNFLLKVFSDNAGVVKVNDNTGFVWKVETHNTPSALDPYGGAITGILGNNRDALGTGVGGAKLIFNTNCLCFGLPHKEDPAPPGAHHPRYIMEGVIAGIADGGNKSGVPTVNGSVTFDKRFAGKPLVFCGTGALMPLKIGDKDRWEKPVKATDWIVMAGGRVGKDGIHGATLSSVHLDESVPQSIVQIGSPFIQKRLGDFLREAVDLHLVKTCTDNGAGGLSSSIGEMATISGGARVDLQKVPLKFGGLKPWEIFVSESQERMTLVVEPDRWQLLQELAEVHEVELSHLGEFTKDQRLQIFWGKTPVAHLDLDFLHNGVPTKELVSKWQAPQLSEPNIPEPDQFNDVLLKLLGHLNICSREPIIRQYDHEVQGKSIIKPLMGPDQKGPQDAAVLRVSFDSYEGLAISNGICPRYGDIDPYHMAAGAFDEAVRQIISVGGKLPDPQDPQTPFWSVNDNFCMPDVVYDPETNPDGHLKLAKLVRMCDALYDQSVLFNIPMTSGKDSMKNDYRFGKTKISIPPTILFSMVSHVTDVRKTVTSDFKRVGDLVYLLGETYDELGASEYYDLWDKLGKNVPKVRPQKAKELYKLVSLAHQKELITSCHDLSQGGLLTALGESVIGGRLGVEVTVQPGDLSLSSYLCSESHSRFLVSISKDNRLDFEKILGDRSTFLGEVSKEPHLRVNYGEKPVVCLSADAMSKAWQAPLSFLGGHI